MLRFKSCLTILLLLLTTLAMGQRKPAWVSGRVVDDQEHPLARVSVTLLGSTTGASTSDSGGFRIKVPSEKAFALVFTSSGHRTEQRNFFLSPGEEEQVTVRLENGTKTLDEVVVTSPNDRREVGLVRVNPRNALIIPSATGGVESLIKIFVGSNNEMTSQYSVRGGNYDENLIYVNDFEVFRPYLVRAGQQEGLSFINPELTGRLSFYNGGFQSRYGDKMSSVLDIQYRKPTTFGGSVQLGLLEQGLHLEGASKDQKFTWLLGVRNRSNQNLFSSQETKGSYVPSSSDLQALVTWQATPKWLFEAMANLSATRFTLIPESAQLTTSVFSPLFSANLGLDIYFTGREGDRYNTRMIGFSGTQQVNRNLKLKWMASRFGDDEREEFDIIGDYLFGERDFDKSKPTFGTIVNPLGAGEFQHFARNNLVIEDFTLAHRGQWTHRKQVLLWGLNATTTRINDRLNEWERQDSAGYTLPYDPTVLRLSSVIKSTADLDVHKLSGFLQDNVVLGDSSGMSLQLGLRFHYNDLNKEFLLSPRAQFSWIPRNRKDIVFKAALGAYHQPPFYRELRRYDGTLNTGVLAQRSWQAVIGADWQFKAWGRPFRLSTEAYYKHMWNVVPYDVDNVRIRYYGENNAKAYATGVEARLFGELVKDAESWVSLGIMRTRENINDDHYYNYYNQSGELITGKTDDQVVADSARVDVGWLRRPTDRLITFGMFFQDYLSTNKNFKVHLNMLYGSNMPYNIPNSVKYRNALIIDPYFRVDIGFSALLLDGERAVRRSHSPFRAFKNIWASLEFFNLLDRRNTISYLLIKDYSNTTYSVPNRLTPRLLNFKIIARF